MAKVWVGPVGKLIEGTVLDVSRKPFERALRDLDPQLYVKWNPRKLNGHGCYEIRRRNDFKEIVDYAVYAGKVICKVDYAEIDMVNHILDCAFLNYDQIRKIKSMDTWQKDHWINNMEYLEQKQREKQLDKAKDVIRQASKEYRREIRDFKEYVASGHDPNRLADHWNKV